MKTQTFKYFYSLFLLLFLISGCSAGSDSKSAPKDKKNIPVVRAQTAKVMAVSETVELTGNIAATKTAKLSSPAEGPIKSLNVREGDFIRKGSVVLRIGRTQSADALLISAQEDLKKEEDELKAVETLVKSGAIPGEQLDKARANFAKAKAQLIRVQENLEDYIIRAPWNGFVSKVHITEGTFVAPRTALVEMFDPGSLVVQFSVPERIAGLITRATKLIVKIDAFPDKQLKAGIIRIYPDLDLKTRSRLIEANLNEKLPVIPGMFVRIKAILNTIPQAVTIPSVAVIQMPNGEKIVYVVSDGKAVRKKINTGIEDSSLSLIQVVNGIEPNEQIVVSGHESLKNGIEVKITGDKKSPSVEGNKNKDSAK